VWTRSGLPRERLSRFFRFLAATSRGSIWIPIPFAFDSLILSTLSFSHAPFLFPSSNRFVFENVFFRPRSPNLFLTFPSLAPFQIWCVWRCLYFLGTVLTIPALATTPAHYRASTSYLDMRSFSSFAMLVSFSGLVFEPP